MGPHSPSPKQPNLLIRRHVLLRLPTAPFTTIPSQYQASFAQYKARGEEGTFFTGTLTVNATLLPQSTVNKASLSATITTATGLDIPTGSTNPKDQAVLTALSAAQAVLNDPNATQAQVDAALAALQAALDARNANTNTGTLAQTGFNEYWALAATTAILLLAFTLFFVEHRQTK